MIRAAVALAVTIAASAAPAVADADSGARLVVVGDACTPGPLRARVAALMGRDPFTVDGDRVVDVELARAGREVVGTIVIDGGRRELHAASCGELIEVIALALAMAIERPSAEPPRVAEPPPATTAIEPAARPRSNPGPGVAVYAGVAGGRASADFEARAVVGAEVRSGRVALGLSFELGTGDEVAVEPGRVVVSTAAFELAGCVRRGAALGCATAAVGWVGGRGEGLVEAAAGTTPYVAPGARLGWEAALSARVAARLAVAVRVPLTRNRFLVDEMPVWSTSAVEGWLGLAIVARIP